jgi:ERCC4-type nuclease
MDLYKQLFGSYSKVCELCNIQPMFKSPLPKEFHNDYRSNRIYIDTREQQPLVFPNSENLKLDVGDYAVTGDDYSYTYADRKSFGDFCSTMTIGFKRFAKELQRCRDLGCYLFIVTEVNLYEMAKKNAFSPKRYNLNYVFHAMRSLQHEFRDCCQFVFSGNRSNSQILIPKLLITGKKLWDTDIQYFLDSGTMNYYERAKK